MEDEDEVVVVVDVDDEGVGSATKGAEEMMPKGDNN